MAKLNWEPNEIIVRAPQKGGVSYPRMFSPDGKRLYCAYDSSEFHRPPAIDIVYSDDGGLTWSETPVTVSLAPDCACANAAFAMLDGEMLIAYRATRRDPDKFRGRLMVSASRDMVNWRIHSVIIEEENDGFFGVWEPHFLHIGGKLAVAYANDSRRVVPEPSMQNLEYKLWEGDHWGEARIISPGEVTKSRDGMPVWDHTGDGIALVLEATVNQPKNPFILMQTSSRDGVHWTENRAIYIPEKQGKKAAAPYIAVLPDGYAAVGFQTDEDSTETGDAYSTMKVMVTGKPWCDTIGCEDFDDPIAPFATPDGYNSMWNGLAVHDGYLLAYTSSNYPTSRVLLRRAAIE